MCPTPACSIFTRTQDFTQKRMYDKLITETKAFNVTYMYIDDILSETVSLSRFVTFFSNSHQWSPFYQSQETTSIFHTLIVILTFAPSCGVYISQLIRYARPFNLQTHIQTFYNITVF